MTRPMLSLWVVLLLTPGGAAQPAQGLSSAASVAASTFAHAAFPALADSFGVPGAVLAVVGPDGPLALEGYGFADLNVRTRAHPERTLFRVGSVSKPVTATACLVLWERGALALHTDVNRALRRVHVPAAFDESVTPHHLLTHTAGFDERVFGGGFAEGAPDLADYLRATLPGRVYPPGLLHSYSNHGYGLLGVVIEEATGLPFPTAVDALALARLGMASSSFAQPPPERLRERLATGYACAGRAADGACTPLPYDYVAFGPAGALQTTAADLARFAAFHLSGVGGVLADSTRRLMHGLRWQPHPALGGMGYGFFRGLLGPRDVLRHAGAWAGWSAQIVLAPEAGVGYVAAVNTDAPLLLNALAERFAADVLGGPYPAPPPAEAGDLSRYAGTYRIARHVHHGPDRIAILAGFPMSDLRVRAEGDTALAFVTGSEVSHAVPLTPGAFVIPGLDPRRFAFEMGPSGHAVRIHGDYASLERIPWWATQRVSLWVLAACALVFATAAGSWFARWIRGRGATPALHRSRSLAALASTCYLAFGLGLAAALVTAGPQGVIYDLPGWVRATFVLPWAGGLATGAAAVSLSRTWHRPEPSVAGRFGLAVTVAAGVLILPVLAYWSLLGLGF